MTYSEDDLTNALISWHKQNEHRMFGNYEPEAFYDHYGNRGSVDLYLMYERPGLNLIEAHIIEVKSEYAVKQVTGANEIIRQFNRARRYFFKDEDRYEPEPGIPESDVEIYFELCFIPSEGTLVHLLNNAPMYNEALSKEVSTADPFNRRNMPSIQSHITFRDPREVTEIVLADGDSRLLPPPKSFIQRYRSVDEDLYQSLERYLTEQPNERESI